MSSMLAVDQDFAGPNSTSKKFLFPLNSVEVSWGSVRVILSVVKVI